MDRQIFRQLSPGDVRGMTDQELETIVEFSKSVNNFTRGNRIKDAIDGLVLASGTAVSEAFVGLRVFENQ
jgi:hypothetical protein